MTFTSIISSQTMVGESVSSDFQSIIAVSPSENTTFSVGSYQELSATAPADDVAANLDDNYSRPAETLLPDEVTSDAGQPEYNAVDSAAAPDIAAALTLPAVNDITTAVSRRSADTGVKANVTADVAETAFAGNVNISVNDASGKSAEYKISTFGGTAPAEHAGGVDNYIISGNSASNNLTVGSGPFGTFRIDDPNVRAIDAEKIDVVGVDSNLCWAGTASNMLYWAGWGKDTGKLTVSIEDDVFDYFRNNFTDKGGWIDAAIEWFLDGKYSNTDTSAATLKTSGNGGFFPNITVSSYLKFDDTDAAVMTDLDSYLRSGDVCGLGVQWDDGSGGHAITCWGFTYDTSVDKSRPNYYTGVWISDSDDNKPDGRNAPDITRYCPVTWDIQAQDYELTYEPGYTGYIDQVVGLASDPNIQVPKTFTVKVYIAISGETVSNGTQTVFLGGITSNNIINSGGGQIVSSGGITYGTILNASGSQHVSTGGAANSTIINSGGSQLVSSGGAANSATVNSGGIQFVYSSGLAAGATVNSGGSQFVYSSGLATGATINNGGSQLVSSCGAATSAIINSGGSQLISSGGAATSAVINSGGIQLVSAGGTANSTTISSGGQQYVASGGTASVINQQAGAAIVAFTGAKITSGTNTRGDGHSAFSIISGIASNFLLENSGLLTVSAGHSAIDTIIASGGQMRISVGGVTTSATITGGKQYISSGGTATFTTINSGGKQYISSGGKTSNTIVNSGGSMYVSSSGIVSGALTVAGGDVILDNAASVSGLTALSYILAATKTNDILVAVNWGTWSPGAAAYSLNLDNAAAGFYILADGVDLSGLKNKTFAVTDNGQNVNVQVGSSYTFNNSSKLSLSYTDSTHDQLIAVLAAQPEVSIAATDADAGEPANNGTFRISRTGDTSIALTVYFNIGGTATGGSDYTLNNGSTTLSNSVVIAAGQSSADVTLNVIDDTIVEKTETAIMSLTADPGYNLGAANSSTINITDNDDNTPPNVPDGLTVTPNGKNVAFDWADCSDSGSGLKNYLLEYALNEQFTGAVQDSITVSNANVSGLAEGVYFWRVQASDNFGNTSDWAPGGSFVIDTTAPSVPTMLTQTVTKSSKTVTFDWAKATDATSGVKQYEVQIDTGSNFNSLINTLISTTNEATAIGLSEGHYYWRVKTMDNSNNWSDWSSAFGFTVDTTAPAVPATLTPVITVNNVALDWTDSSDATSGLKNYLLQYALNDQFTGAVQRSITASNANVSGLADGVYYWRVQSVDNSDNGSDWITGDKFTVDTTKPNVPGGLTNTPDGKSVTLDWNAASDATSGVKQYEIQVDNNINFNSLDAFKRVAGNQVSVDNLSAGTYYWRVRAQDNSGNLGDWSSPASFILELIPPTVPGGLKQTVTGSSVAFNWTASTDASSIRQYQIQVDNNSNFSSPEYSATLAASATPTAGDSLTTGTYYWQVRAQDKAGNWSAWSKSSSFTVTPPDIGANTWQLAKDIANPVNLDNWVGFNDSADVYKLSMTRAGTLTLGLTGLSGNADLSLLSSAGAVLKTSLNPGTAPEAINNAALLTGTYYVKVAAGTGVTNAAYTLSNTINYFDGDSIDMAGNTTAAAKVVSGSSQTSGWVGFGDPADYYKLTMTGAGTLTLNLTGLSSDANLTLYDAKGKQLNTSNNKNIADENIINPALPGGDYYIKIAPADGGKSTVNNTGYTLKNTISYFAGDTIDNAGNTIVTAKLVDASLPAQPGWVGLGDSDDYYRFAVAASTQSTLRLDMAGGNADLSLYDSNGKLLQKSAKTGTSEDMITRNLTAGIYYARVNAVSGSNIDYTLTFDKKALAGILAS